MIMIDMTYFPAHALHTVIGQHQRRGILQAHRLRCGREIFTRSIYAHERLNRNPARHEHRTESAIKLQENRGKSHNAYVCRFFFADFFLESVGKSSPLAIPLFPTRTTCVRRPEDFAMRLLCAMPSAPSPHDVGLPDIRQ